MDMLFSGWEDVVRVVQENASQLIWNPIVWVLGALVAIGIYGLYDVSNTARQNGMGNVIRQFLQVLLDTTGDLINALRSVTGFIGVLRMFLFGKLNKHTLSVLSNYAIVFLSLLSFSATYQGMTLIFNSWILGAFGSFGIQVSILVCAIHLARKSQDIENIENVKTQVRYGFGRTDDAGFDKSGEEISVDTKELRGIIYKGILVASIFVSSMFSYFFMFNKFVGSQLAYDDYFRTVSESHKVSSKYSNELATYTLELTQVLVEYNDRVEEWLNLQEENPMVRQNSLAEKQEDVEKLELQVNDAQARLDALEFGSDEYIQVQNELERLQDDYDEAENTYEKEYQNMMEDKGYQNELLAYESILELNNFYSNPIYLRGSYSEGGVISLDAAITEQTKLVWQYFSNLQMAEAALRSTSSNEEHRAFDEAKAVELQQAFSNYVNLSAFYAKQGASGINFSEINEELAVIEFAEKSEELENTYRQQSFQVLEKMIQTMGEVPILGDVENVWEDTIFSFTGKIKAPEQAEYLQDIYDLYRDNSGTTHNFERALRKILGIFWFSSEKKLLSFELVFVAFITDISIVALTFMRTGEVRKRSISDMRRVLGILFIDDAIDKESVMYRKGQGFGIVIGLVGGVLTYLLYRLNVETPEAQVDMLTFLMFLTFGLILGLLGYRLYWKVRGYDKSWQNEALYLKWKEIWVNGVSDERELERRIALLRAGKMPDGIELTEADILNIADLSKGENAILFETYFYPQVLDLFAQLKVKTCYRKSYIKQLDHGRTQKRYVEMEKIQLPCLKEAEVEKVNLKAQFSVLKAKHLVGYDKDASEGWYIFTELFWNLLYDCILLRVVGGRLGDYDIEEELFDDIENEDIL